MTLARASASAWAACILLAAAAIYWPALSTGFLLDDSNNLGHLRVVGDEGLLFYAFGSSAGPSGRPLSLLTFALQYSSWPDHPFAFKAVNLAIHLACGGLILLLVRRLAGLCSPDHGRPAAWAMAITTTALWLLHPIQSTTVLYVVQRMTQLSALFTLLGLVLYVLCRERYAASPNPVRLATAGLAVWGCTALAILCKENGILLPLFALIIDATLLSRIPQDAVWRKWSRVILWTPLAALLAYLAWTFDATLSSYASRPFTMAERVLAQSAVLLDYARKILVPLPGSFSIYHDDLVVGRGLLSGPWEITASALVAGIAAGALVLRRRFPFVSFGVLWFFAGHLLESSHLSLELYFEHRNYLPSLGLFVVIAHVILSAGRHFALPAMAAGVLAAYTAAAAAVTVSEVRLWADPLEKHLHLLRQHPESPRAITAFGNFLISTGRVDDAENFYRRLAEERPLDIYPRLKLMAIAACVRDQPVDAGSWLDLLQDAQRARYSDFGIAEELVLIVTATAEGDCQTLDRGQLTRLLVTLALNPDFWRDRPELHELAAHVGVLTGDAGVAYHNVVEAVNLAPSVPRQLLKLQILLALGKPEETQESLRALKAQLESSVSLRIAYGRAVDRLEKAAAAATGTLRGGAKTGEN